MLERLLEAQVPIFRDELNKNLYSKLSSFKNTDKNTSKNIQEKILAEIFFTLSLGLAKMSKLGIAHRNITPENILLDYNLEPYFSQFESAVENADKELLAKDLKALGNAMEISINATTFDWVKSITYKKTLLDLRENLHNLAVDVVAGEISTVDELLTSLISIYPELIEDTNQYLPPAVSIV